MEYKDIGQLVQEIESNYISGTGTQMSKYVNNDLYEDINTIYAYLNSKHISGPKDSLGRDKPFANIVVAARNIWFRATDIDRKNIFAKPTKESDTVGAFLLTVALQDWMRRENFGKFLNAWGLVQAGFNSAVVKFVEKDGRLIPSVIPWSQIIVDQIDFDNNPKIEVLQLTEAQMFERFDRDKVENLIEDYKARETLDKRRKDNKSNYFKVYEVHGKFPLSTITGNDADEDTYTQQIHVLSFLSNKKTRKNDQYTLYSGEEAQDPYMLTSLLPSDDGSVSLDGSVKNLFEAQWMTNHTAKQIKDQLDLSSKILFQTSDPRFLGQNALFNSDVGDIFLHDDNRPLTPVNNNAHDITALQNNGQMWKALGSEINGISEAMMGINPPSGSAWRQTEAMLQESHSLFQIMRENRGLDIEDMMRRFVFPYLKKKLRHSKEIAATLDTRGIKQIEQRFIKNTAIKKRNEMIKEQFLAGNLPEVPTQEELQGEIQSSVLEQGNNRFFKPSEINDKTWADILKDIEWDVEVDVTGESSDMQAVLTTLNTALQVAANPQFATNPTAQLVVGRILTETGKISPMEWNETINETRQQAQNAPTGGGKVASEQLQELAKQSTNGREKPVV